MYREREEPSVTGRWPGRRGHRAALRGAAAGVVAGLGVSLAPRQVPAVSGGPAASGLYDVPFVVLSVALLYAGYWLLRSEFDHRRVGRVALWSLAGFVVLVAVGVWLAGGRAGVQGTATLVADVGTVGASSGLLVGLCGERRRRGLDREATLAAERAEERFAFLNRLLRHHLLNGVAVVRGHAELLTEEGADREDAVEIIRRRSDEVVRLVRNVETLSRTFTDDLPAYAVDPAPPLRAAIEAAEATGAVVDVSGDVSVGRRVLANGRLQVVFEIVVEEAAGVAADGHVTVETANRGGEFVASVAFDGRLAGAPDAATEAGDHGDDALGLFIAETLVEYFGGSLAVERTGERSVLTVVLPLAD